MEALPPLEAIRPWLSTGFLGTLVVLVVYFGKPIATAATTFFLENRRLKLEEDRDRRAGMKEADALERETFSEVVTRLRAEVERIDQRHRECEKEVSDLRGRLRKAEDGLAGLARQFATFQQSVAAAIPPENYSEEMREMLARRGIQPREPSDG